MRYEIINETHILGKYKYHAQYAFYFEWITDKDGKKCEKWNTPSDLEVIENIEYFLISKAEGNWKRIGNNFYLEKLGDVFSIRLFFDEGLKFIRATSDTSKNISTL
jgi:hypothetical protein